MKAGISPTPDAEDAQVGAEDLLSRIADSGSNVTYVKGPPQENKTKPWWKFWRTAAQQAMHLTALRAAGDRRGVRRRTTGVLLTLGRLAWLVGVALLVLVVNVAVSILYMVVYGHLINPGRKNTTTATT